jgi:glycerol-3-phosphate dehydrogenase
LVSILGGKWTTYRHMAEQTIDAVEGILNPACNGSFVASKTHDHLLAGASDYTPGFWQTLVHDYKLNEATAQHLAEKFGTEARAVADLIKNDPSLALPMAEGAAAIRAEIVYCSRQEMACTVEDILAMMAAPVVASHLAKEQAWSSQQESEATQEYIQKIRRMYPGAGAAVR